MFLGGPRMSCQNWGSLMRLVQAWSFVEQSFHLSSELLRSPAMGWWPRMARPVEGTTPSISGGSSTLSVPRFDVAITPNVTKMWWYFFMYFDKNRTVGPNCLSPFVRAVLQLIWGGGRESKWCGCGRPDHLPFGWSTQNHRWLSFWPKAEKMSHDGRYCKRCKPVQEAFILVVTSSTTWVSSCSVFWAAHSFSRCGKYASQQQQPKALRGAPAVEYLNFRMSFLHTFQTMGYYRYL